MSLCSACGNVLVQSCGPVCLVCQRTGRAEWPDVIGSGQGAIGSGQSIEHHAKALSVALDAVYEALESNPISLTPIEEFKLAQDRLRFRIRFPGHHRERPDLEDRQEGDFCQTCLGTGRYLAGRCPDCQNEES
jgi:hypothetical protein